MIVHPSLYLWINFIAPFPCVTSELVLFAWKDNDFIHEKKSELNIQNF